MAPGQREVMPSSVGLSRRAGREGTAGWEGTVSRDIAVKATWTLSRMSSLGRLRGCLRGFMRPREPRALQPGKPSKFSATPNEFGSLDRLTTRLFLGLSKCPGTMGPAAGFLDLSGVVQDPRGPRSAMHSENCSGLVLLVPSCRSWPAPARGGRGFRDAGLLALSLRCGWSAVAWTFQVLLKGVGGKLKAMMFCERPCVFRVEWWDVAQVRGPPISPSHP